MPGRLVMDQHAVQGPDGLKKDLDQSAPHTNGSSDISMLNDTGLTDFAQAKKPETNGNGTFHNASSANGSLQSTSDAIKGKSVADQDGPPPELEHWAHTYVPMGKLLERVAQQCYSDLTEVVDAMADMPVQQAAPAINGAGSHGSSHPIPDQSQASIEKKLRLMNFAQEHKDRFLKFLVLSNWARNMEDMDRLIELRMWLQQQDDASSSVADAIVRMKHNMIPAKMPNPNIPGALELLSTAKAPWMPDLGYIPPKPLTARQLLKTLRDMNFALSVRLNLHEDLPPHFRTYPIANGRATFTVSEEFEVDLAVVDDDPDSAFYFIDLRLLFSTSPAIADGGLRTNIEGKVNEVLASDGLSGCYHFLHDFALTHRTNLLRRQAFDLIRGKWNQCIRIETIHRDFVIQYWIGRPGGKSWIQVGTLSSSKTRNPQLGIRWVREGQDSTDVDIEMKGTTRSIENILEQVISNHIRWRLRRIADGLVALSGNQTALEVEIEHDLGAYSLHMRFDHSRTPLSLRISPVTGDFSISPATPIAIEAEIKLNSDNTLDAVQILSGLHCKLVQDQIRKHAQRLGWVPVPLARQDDVRQVFGSDVVRWSVFTPRHWGNSWAIAVTMSLRGARWWVAHTNTVSDAPFRTIKSAEQLSLRTSPAAVNRATLMDIESKSLAQISFSNITKQLRLRSIQYELKQANHETMTESTKVARNTAVVYLNFIDLMRPRQTPSGKVWKPWCNEVLVLTHHGMTEPAAGNNPLVTHVLKATLTQQAASSLAKLGSSENEKDDDLTFSPAGTCGIRLYTNFGEGLVDLIEARLKLVERIQNYISLAHQAKLKLTHSSITRLDLQYHTDPSLSATFRFPQDPRSAIELELHASGEGQQAVDANPQRRIQPLLQKLLEPADGLGSETGDGQEYQRFRHLLHVLDFTLPLLRKLSSMEKAESSTIAVRGSSYAFGHHRLIYSSPLPDIAFDMLMRTKDGRGVWLVTVARSKNSLSKELAESLRRVWSSMGQGWSGLTTGAFAEKKGIESLLDRLDAAVRETQTTKPEQKSEGDGQREIVVLD